MRVQVSIGPHERSEALQVFGDWLTPAQREKIKSAPEDAWINLLRENHITRITVMEKW